MDFPWLERFETVKYLHIGFKHLQPGPLVWCPVATGIRAPGYAPENGIDLRAGWRRRCTFVTLEIIFAYDCQERGPGDRHEENDSN